MDKKDLLTTTSHTWANNLKLLQVLKQIDFSYLKDLVKEKDLVTTLSTESLALINAYQFDSAQAASDTYFSNLFSELDQATLAILFERATHSFNQAEIEFIQDSWNEKEQRSAQLRRERDEARAESRRANRLAHSNNNALKAMQVDKTDPTLALRMAEANYMLYPESRSAAGIFAELWNNSSKAKVIKTLRKGFNAAVRIVSYSPDGKTLFTGFEDSAVELYDLQGNELQSFPSNLAGIFAVAFSADGQSLLIPDPNGAIKLYHIQGEELQRFQHGMISAVALSPDGKLVLTGSYDRTAKLWDMEGNELQRFSGHTSAYVSKVGFSPNGQIIFTVDYNTVKLWDMEGNELNSFKCGDTEVDAIVFSPDSQTILTGSWDKTVKLWDLEGKALKNFHGHTDYISAVAFSPDGKMILTGSYDKTARLWDLEGNELKIFVGHTDYVASVAFSPNGKTVLTGAKIARLWDLQKRERQRFQPTKSVSSVSFSPDGKTVLTSMKGGSILIWNLAGKELKKLEGSPGYHAEVAVTFSPNGKMILTGSAHNTARLWDSAGRELLSFQTNESVSSVAFSPNGKMMLTGSAPKITLSRNLESKEPKIATLWDLEGKELQSFQHDKSISVVAFSPNGKTILTCTEDSIIRLWNLQGKELQSFRGSANSIHTVAFSPDGKTILVGSSYEIATLWDLEGKELLRFQGYTVPKDDSSIGFNQFYSKIAAAFSPNGQIVLTGAEDGTVKLWDLMGNELYNFKGANDAITSLAFSPDGKTILVGSTNKTATLWLNPIHCLANNLATYSKYELEASGLKFTEADWRSKKKW